MFRSFPRTRESRATNARVRGPGSPLSAFALSSYGGLSSQPTEALRVGGSRGRAEMRSDSIFGAWARHYLVLCIPGRGEQNQTRDRERLSRHDDAERERPR